MREPTTEAGRSLMRFMDTQVGCGDILADIIAIEDEARQQGREPAGHEFVNSQDGTSRCFICLVPLAAH